MTLTRRSLLKGAVASAGAVAVGPLFTRAETFAGTPLLRPEAQCWWRKAGIVVPSQVGEHIHLEVEHPDPDAIYDGIVNFNVHVITHQLSGPVTTLRVADQSAIRRTISIPPMQGDSDAWFDFAVDFGKWPTGRREMRWTANCPRNADGLRQYQSTGYQVSVRASTPRYRTDPFIEARGWYSAHGYANARWLTRLADIRSGATVKIRIGPGSGGKPTKLAIVSLNPHYHDGDPGTELLRRTAAGTYSVVVPDGSAGKRLVAISSDGFVAGVSAVTVQ